MKKIFCLVLTVVMLHCVSVDASEKIKVYIFTKADEPICEKTLDFFESLKEDYGKYFEYEEYEIWDAHWKENAYYRELAENVAQKFNDEIIGAPYIVIGDKYSYDEYAESMNDELKAAILDQYENDAYTDVVKATDDKLKKEKSKESVYTGAILIGISVTSLTIILLARKSSKKKEG